MGSDIGAYRLVRLLGEGGMGAVYEVEHRELGVRFALKVLSPAAAGDAGLARARFLAEGRVLARLRHPNLVRVYDLGFDARTGAPYYVMDLILGDDGNPHTLADAFDVTPDENALVRWFGEVASALDYIHMQGVVHRDVKPGNVLVAAGGHVFLSDFGVSRFFSAPLNEAVRAVHTSTVGLSATQRRVFGTRGFVAPEVMAGRPATPAADVYALGVVFVYLLTGMWYERGSQILRMLETYERPWGAVLPPMLGDISERPEELEPLAVRLTESVGPVARILDRWFSSGHGWGVKALAVASALIMILAGILNVAVLVYVLLLRRGEPLVPDRMSPGRQQDYFGSGELYKQEG